MTGAAPKAGGPTNAKTQDKAPMTISSELIVGTARVRPVRIETTGTGIVAELSGAGLLTVVDATFDGDAMIELWTAGHAPRSMTVTGIDMGGATTLVTLTDTARPVMVN